MGFGQELSAVSLLKLLSFLFWSCLYLWYSAQSPKQSPEWCSRAVTLLHGSVASIVGLIQCGVLNLTPYRLTMKIRPWHYALMVWSWGYFAFDLLWCLVYWTEGALMLCHHTTALLAINIYMQKSHTGCTFACTMALLEITNPLLQTRWFIRNAGFDKTMVFLIIELIYLATFISFRGIIGSYVMYKIVNSDLFDVEEKIISFVFYLVSLAFIYEMLGYVLHRYRTRLEPLKTYLEETGVVLND
ncbi:hypothetical protein K1T71_008581 [Dendrolimus kikuchii]|uniref:Uncharacterized protein n=1 Tax=Dendrolimus kikuchii TaxID=765133 RepID=A0ACC1CVX6_9NEOP|nr:hypothetical protein K1T71_008581 [Dendrolimus kikuchii]